MAKKNKGAGNALVQGSILAIASIISRIIGLIYRIPMQNILGDIGIGYYSTAFEIYNVMLIISSYSLPTAVSKMVSAQMAKKNRRQTYQILKCALLFATTTGTIVALILFFGGEFFATTLLNTPFSIFALKILAPTLLVVAILGVLRGFFQGLGTMMPSAVQDQGSVPYLEIRNIMQRRMALRAVHWELRSVQLRHLYLLYLYI